jgi:hypothetical protein
VQTTSASKAQPHVQVTSIPTAQSSPPTATANPDTSYEAEASTNTLVGQLAFKYPLAISA